MRPENQSDYLEVDLIAACLEEDVGSGDLTASIIPEQTTAQATVITREEMVVCGQAWFEGVFKALGGDVEIEWQTDEGKLAPEGTVLCRLLGPARQLLTGERTALNLLQTLSATATISRRYASAVEGAGAKVLDTRKTIPALRKAQKYAVACGGCTNHRMGLYDGILIKENHILAAGSIGAAVEAAKSVGKQVPVEVEVESLDEVRQALTAGADILLLDNFDLQMLRDAVKLNSGQAKLEASGNVELETIRDIAETGVDFISVGALTKNIKAIDLSMRVQFLS